MQSVAGAKCVKVTPEPNWSNDLSSLRRKVSAVECLSELVWCAVAEHHGELLSEFHLADVHASGQGCPGGSCSHQSDRVVRLRWMIEGSPSV